MGLGSKYACEDAAGEFLAAVLPIRKNAIPRAAGEVFSYPLADAPTEGRSIRQKCKTNWDKIEGRPGRKAGAKFLATPPPWRSFDQE